MAKTYFVDESLFEACATQVIRQVHELSSQQLVNAAW